MDEVADDALLDAFVEIAEDLDLDATLRRTVQTAIRLTGARYGALGVLDEQGEALARFIHEGLTEAEAARLGDLPTGRGLLGAVIRDPAPLRVDDVASHPDSVELPAGHPPVGAFLGVPVRVTGQVFGNLYLTGKPTGFDDRDERVLRALAAAAGSAIRNAGVAASLGARALLERALAELATAVLAGADRAEVLHATAVAANGLLPSAAATVVRRPGTGPGRTEDTSWRFPLEDEDGDVLVVDASEVSPWRATDEARSAMATLARQAGVAVRWADARAEVSRLAVIGERDRIARDLHDTVIQQLFGAGLQLDALARRADERTSTGIDRVIQQVDEAIAELRSMIGRLDAPPATDVRDRLEAVVAAFQPATPALDELSVTGDLGLLDERLGGDVAAVLREAISNAARHAEASSITPSVVVGEDEVWIEVVDDGIGPAARPTTRPSSTESLGLRNMSARAERHGGRCELVPGDERGARLRWSAPLPVAAD